jgi:hypothetical protein
MHLRGIDGQVGGGMLASHASKPSRNSRSRSNEAHLV